MPIQGGTVRWIIEADDSQFNQTAENVSKTAEELTSTLNEKKTSNFWSNLVGDTRGVGSAIKQIGSSLGSIGWGTFQAGATGAVAALGSLVKKGIQATDFLESSRTAMSGLTGSVEAGNKAMSIAANYWQNNPFQRIDVTNATKQLVQFGRTTNDIAGDLEILGNVSLSTGTDISELARYYARVSASGRAMTQDLEMMSDRGIPIYRELAEALGTTTQGVREMASKGKIDFETFKKAMEGAVDPEAMKSFEETLSRQTDRLKGSISILSGQLAGYKIINDQLVISEGGLEKAWTRLLKTLATELRSDKMKVAMEKIGDALAKIVDKITEFIPLVMGGLSKAISFIGDNSATLIPILGGILTFVGKLGTNLPILGPIIQNITGNVKGLWSGFSKLFSTSPLLATFLAVFAGGIIPALKNSEEFRNAIKSLATSLGKLVQSLGGALKNIIQVISTILSSEAVTGILTLIAQLLAKVAEIIASFPTNVLTTIVSAFLMFNLMKASPIAGYTTALLAFVAVIKKFGPQITESLKAGFEAVKNFFANLGTNLANAAKGLATAGHNLMIGLANGIAEGSKKVFDFIGQIGSNIVKYFQSIMGIHSPSTVMAEQGKYVTLGLAQGITDSASVVQKAMDSLATDILNSIESIINNKVDFGILDYQSQYKEWQKISKMFTAGSQQYQYAIRKMEEARKQANLQILSLQKEYNDALDSTIEKISSAYGLFDSVDTSGGKGADEIISNLDQQVAELQNFASSKEIIAGLDLSEGLKEELQNLGVDASKELAAIANMTGDQLAKLNELWIQKQAQANRAAVTEMGTLKDQTLKKVDEIKKGIDEETVSLVDSGGRLIESISEGVYGAMPSLESAFSQMDDYIAKAAKELSSGSASAALQDAGAQIPSELTTGVDTGIEETKSDFELSAKELGDSLISSLGGIVLGIAAFKLGPKIISALGGTKLGSSIGGFFKNLFGKGSVATDVASAVSTSSTIATGSTTIAQNVSTAGQGFSTAQSVMNTIIKGAGTIILVAASLAAIAVAMRVAYEALHGVEWGELIADLGGMLGTIAVASAIAGVIGIFAKYVALGAVVEAVVSGVIALCAFLLAEASKNAKNIDAGAIFAMEGIIAGVSAILTAISLLSIFTGIGTLIQTVIGSGLLILAHELESVSAVAKRIDVVAFKNLNNAIIAAQRVFDGVSMLDSIKNTIMGVINDLFGGLLVGLSEELKAISANGSQVKLSNIDKIKDGVKSISEIDSGNILTNLKNIINSGMLVPVADNVRNIADKLATMPKINKDKVDKIKEVVSDFSTIKIQGSGLFENKGGAAEELLKISGYIRSMADNLNNIPKIEKNNLKDRIAYFIDCIKLFDRIDDNARNGIKRLSDLGDALGNIDWTKKILGDIGFEDDQYQRIVRFVDSIKLFDRIDNKAREGLRYLNDLGDALGNIDWAKKILSNVPDDLETGADNIIKGLAKFANLESGVRDGLRRLDNLGDSLGNIDWAKKILKDISYTQENYDGIERFISTINLFDRVKQEARDGIRRLADLWDSLSNIESLSRILKNTQYTTENYDGVERFISTIKLFDRIDENARKGIRRLADLWDALSNIDALIRTLSGIDSEIIGKNAESLINAINKFSEISKEAATRIYVFKELEGGLGKVDWFKQILGDIPEDIVDKAGLLVSAINKMSEVSLDKETIDNALATASEIVNNIKDGILNGITGVKEAGKTLMQVLIDACRERIGDIKTLGVDLANSFIEGINSKNEEISQAGADMQGAIWNAIQPKLDDEYHQGEVLAKKLKEGFESISFSKSGTNAVNGFISGANGEKQLNSIYKAGWNIADNFLKGLKKRAGENSPWKTTEQSGIFASAGLAEGIAKSTALVVNQAQNLVDEVTDVMSMDDIMISPEFAPTVGGARLPLMGYDEGFVGGRSVEINQTNNNYSNYSMRKINDDLRWELSKI